MNLINYIFNPGLKTHRASEELAASPHYSDQVVRKLTIPDPSQPSAIIFKPLSEEDCATTASLSTQINQIHDDLQPWLLANGQSKTQTPVHSFHIIYRNLFDCAQQMKKPDLTIESALPKEWQLNGHVAGIPKIQHIQETSREALYLSLSFEETSAGIRIQTPFCQLDDQAHEEVKAFIKSQVSVYMTDQKDLPIATPFYIDLESQMLLADIYDHINPNQQQHTYNNPSKEDNVRTFMLGNRFYAVMNPLLAHLEKYLAGSFNTPIGHINMQNVYNEPKTAPLNFFSGAIDDRSLKTIIHHDQEFEINGSLPIIGPSTRIIPTSLNNELINFCERRQNWCVSSKTQQSIAKSFRICVLPAGFLSFWRGSESKNIVAPLYHYAPVYTDKTLQTQDRLTLILSSLSNP
jgi:hypothetical protein